MFELPYSINIGDTTYAIRNRGDFRMVLDCFKALEDEELEESERVLSTLIIFYEDFNSVDDLLDEFGNDLSEPVKAMSKFFNCGQDSSPGYEKPYKLVNWEKDSMLISSAINNVANIEVRAVDYIHWWTFMGYYMSIGDSVLATVVGIRDKIKSGKKLEKDEQKFKRENPSYFVWDSVTLQQQEELKDIMEMWNSEE